MVIPAALQEFQEAADRHVGDRVQLVEDDAVAALEFAAIVGFDGFLRRRQERPDWVVHQVQAQLRLGLSIAEPVQ